MAYSEGQLGYVKSSPRIVITLHLCHTLQPLCQLFQQELSAIVSAPACNYIQTVDSFLELAEIGYSAVQLAKQSKAMIQIAKYNGSKQ